ncbi:hypothetical protein HK096_000640, partial [Nowakowskiella sp. JEL0078]
MTAQEYIEFDNLSRTQDENNNLSIVRNILQTVVINAGIEEDNIEEDKSLKIKLGKIKLMIEDTNPEEEELDELLEQMLHDQKVA